MKNAMRDAANVLIGAAVVAGMVLSGAPEGWAQQKGKISKQQLMGAWTYVSAESVAKDGTKYPLVRGANPKGSTTSASLFN